MVGDSPTPRGETCIAYDARTSRLVLFGGWSNRWFGDLHVCKVGDVVGPPYAIDSISPTLGPLTGMTKCTILGVGFKSSGNQVITSQSTCAYAPIYKYILNCIV